MKRTTADDFRSNLKGWMDTARVEPIKVTRRSGETFILVNSEEFERIQMELISLRGIAQGLSDVISGRVNDSDANSIGRVIEKAKEKVHKKAKKSG